MSPDPGVESGLLVAGLCRKLPTDVVWPESRNRFSWLTPKLRRRLQPRRLSTVNRESAVDLEYLRHTPGSRHRRHKYQNAEQSPRTADALLAQRESRTGFPHTSTTTAVSQVFDLGHS